MAERNYIIPLRREYQKAPIYARTKKAIKAIREYLQKHMKHEDVKLGRRLNMYIWQNGNRNPPHKVEVVADVYKDKDVEYVMAELAGHSLEELKPKVEVKKASGIAGKLEEKLSGDKKVIEKKKIGAKKSDKQVIEAEKKVEEQKEAVKLEMEKPLEKSKEKVAEVKQESKEVKQEQKVVRADKSEPVKK